MTSLVGVAMALAGGSHWLIVFLLVAVYSMLIMADSATLTAGLVSSAEPGVRGAAMGLYSLIGFGGGGVLGPAIFGFALDLSGRGLTPVSWAIGFATLGLGCLLFPLFDWWLHRTNPFRDR
jgi:MFS family permease